MGARPLWSKNIGNALGEVNVVDQSVEAVTG